MEGNATLTMIKQRIKNDIKNATVQMENENSKKEALEKKMSEMQAIIDQMVKDIQNTTAVRSYFHVPISFITYTCFIFSRTTIRKLL